MNVWVGCLLPKEFAISLRRFCNLKNQDLGLSNLVFHLPQHISLKISFSVEKDKVNEVIDGLDQLLIDYFPFYVQSHKLMYLDNVLAIDFRNNGNLERIHKKIDQYLLSTFNIPMHPFDKDFIFHSSIYLDDNINGLKIMEHNLNDFHIPKEMPIEEYVFGIEDELNPGYYQIIRTHRIPF